MDAGKLNSRGLAALLACTALMPAAHASSTGSLEGFIIDAATSQPLGSAYVIAGNASVSAEATTDQTGHFILPLLPPGEYSISAHGEGYGWESATATIHAGHTAWLRLPIVPVALDSGCRFSTPKASALDPKSAETGRAITRVWLDLLPH